MAVSRRNFGERPAVGSAVLIALLLSMMYMRASNGVTPDSYEYMKGGVSLVGGEGYLSLTGRALRYAANHRAAFLLLQSADHLELAELVWDPVTTDRLTPLARLEAGEGAARRAWQLYRLNATEPEG